MAENPLSLAEKTFILHGVDADFRTDGRRQCEYRSIEVETKLMPQTNGSCRLRIGNSDILVGVKTEIDTPFPERPDEGKIEFFVDCSANATPEFEGKGGNELGTEISNILTNAYRSPSSFDLKSLCIMKDKKCWKMYVDILILQCGGNLFDAIGSATKAAIFSTEIPRLTTVIVDGGEVDIQVSDDPFDCMRLNVENVPVLVTLCKIGDSSIVDPTAEEEACASASIVVSVTPNGKVTSTVKTGYGSLLPTTLLNILETAVMVGKKLDCALMEALQKEEALGYQRKIIGFLQ